MFRNLWICKKCDKIFNPINDEENYTFTCPECGSTLTVPYSFSEDGFLEKKLEKRTSEK